jgi:hypothetical protein
LLIQQSIEGLRVVDLLLGTTAAKTVTVRFGFKGPAGNYAVSLRNGAGTRSYIAPFTITAGEANTDVVRIVTVALDQVGTWTKDNTLGLSLAWIFFSGTTYQSAPNVWQAGNFLWPTGVTGVTAAGSVFELFDVGLYVGTTTPAFHVPDYVSELQVCKRYFAIIEINFQTGAAGGYWIAPYTWPVEMRITPTITNIVPGTITGSISIQSDSVLSNLSGWTQYINNTANSSLTGRRNSLNARM